MTCKHIISLFVYIVIVTPIAAQQNALGWGSNNTGQVGDGTTTQRTAPVSVLNLTSNVTGIATGANHSLAIRNGAAFAWGDNTFGELGDGTTTNRTSPVAVGTLTSNVTSISGGNIHSLAIRNGAVFAWGVNGNGQLGDNTTINRTSPVGVLNLTSNVTAISAGTGHSLAIQNGAAFAWGANNSGQLGDGTITQRNMPVAVLTLINNVTSISAGQNHSLAIRNGGAFAWGFNGFGQLGDGTTTQRLSPVAVSTLTSSVTAISAGLLHSLAIQNGEVYAWGLNSSGQIGDGTVTQRSSPVLVTGGALPDNFINVAAGSDFSFALTALGQLYAWGSNSNGQLGLGDTTNRLVPTQLFAPSGYAWIGLEGGGDHAIAFAVSVPEPHVLLLLVVLVFASWMVNHRHGVTCESARLPQDPSQVAVELHSALESTFVRDFAIGEGAIVMCTPASRTSPRKFIMQRRLFSPTNLLAIAHQPSIAPGFFRTCLLALLALLMLDQTIFGQSPIYTPYASLGFIGGSSSNYHVGVNDSIGRFYVVTSGTEVSVFSTSTLAFLETITPGNTQVWGVAGSDFNGQTYFSSVTPPSTAQLRRFSASGQIGSASSAGTTAARGLTVNRLTGQVYVVDQVGSSIRRYSDILSFQTSFATGLTNALGIGINSSLGRLYVTDTATDTVNAFDLSGNPLFSVAPGFDVNYLGVSEVTGRVYVGNRVYDADLNLITNLPIGGSGTGVSKTGLVFITNSTSGIKVLFNPGEWVAPATHQFQSLTLNENLTLNAGMNLVLSGSATITSGTVVTVGAGTFSAASTANSGTLAFANPTDTTFASVITGTGALTKSAAGTLFLTGNNTYSGKSTVTGGAIAISADANLGTAPGSPVADQLTLNGGTLRFIGNASTHANRGITIGTSGSGLDSTVGITGTITGAIIGTGGLQKTGFGTIVLSGNLSGFTGPTTISQGTLQFDSGLTSAGGIVRVEGSGTLQANASVTRPILGNGPGSTINVGASGITLGDATSFIGFNHQGMLNIGVNSVTLASAIQPRLGSLTTLGSGGTPGAIISAKGVYLDFATAMTGYGTINTPNNLVQRSIINGAVEGNSGAQPITFTGWVKGVGTFNNVVFSGTWDPGFSPTLITAGSLGFSSTNNLIMELGGLTRGSQFDGIEATGNIDLAGALSIVRINGFTPNPADAFVLINRTGGTGIFTGLNEGDTFAGADGGLYVISYQGINHMTNQMASGANGFSVVIAAVPEPTTWALIGLGVAGCSWVGFRRYRSMRSVLDTEVTVGE